jgi:Recombinase zinc beta ribbon domain
VRCGQCGRRMIVGYGGASARRTLQYRCRRPTEYDRRGCQLVGGKRIEAAVVEAFLEVTAAGGAEAAGVRALPRRPPAALAAPDGAALWCQRRPRGGPG